MNRVCCTHDDMALQCELQLKCWTMHDIAAEVSLVPMDLPDKWGLHNPNKKCPQTSLATWYNCQLQSPV